MKKRIIIGLLPLITLLVVVGCYALGLFAYSGGAIDVILRENYRSIVAMQNIKESAERLDSALFFTLAGEWDRSRKMYEENMPAFEKNLVAELGNVTVPGEGELSGELQRLHERYIREANRFMALSDLEERRTMYFGEM